MTIEAGRVLCGRYRLVRPVGQGAQASVWIADHLALSTQVAVKLIDPELAKQSDALERFKREATAAAQLRSAHVVQILDHGVDDAQPFIVMEFMEGEDLFERIEKRKRLSLKETSKIITQVARALTRAHAAGIVHRDLKPENVFLVPNEDDEVAKVLDFGVAKVRDPAKQTMQRTGVGTLIGTPHYMSPEQVKGVSEVDFKTDIWALGVMAYQCVTGQLPFDSEGVGDLLIKITIGDLPVPSKIVPTLPATFDAWFAKCCDRDPDKRFESAREASDALGKAVGIVADRPAGIPRPSADAGPSSKPGVPLPPKRPATPPARRAAEVLDSSLLVEAEVAPAVAPPPQKREESNHDVDVEMGDSIRPPAPPSEPPLPSFKVGTGAGRPVGRIAPVAELAAAPPPPSKPEGPPSSTVSGLASAPKMSLPPPELDGARRRRNLWLVLLALAAIGGGVAWFTIRPHFDFRDFTRSAAAPTEAAPTSTGQTVIAVPTAVQFEPTAAPVGSAVDPGKTAHRPTATSLPAPAPASAKPAPKGKRKKPGASDEPTIEVPDPDDHGPEPKGPGSPPPAPEPPDPPGI